MDDHERFVGMLMNMRETHWTMDDMLRFAKDPLVSLSIYIYIYIYIYIEREREREIQLYTQPINTNSPLGA